MSKVKICLVGNNNLSVEALESVLNSKGFATHSEGFRKMFEDNYVHSVNPEVVILEEQIVTTLGPSVFKLSEKVNAKFKTIFILSNKSMHFLGAGLNNGINGFVHVKGGLKELEKCLVHVMDGVIYISPLFSGPKPVNGNKQHNFPVDKVVMTEQEENILKLVHENKTSREIGNILNISTKTVQNHRHNLCNKLGLKGRNKLYEFSQHYFK